jgi:hypothetical protein
MPLVFITADAGAAAAAAAAGVPSRCVGPPRQVSPGARLAETSSERGVVTMHQTRGVGVRGVARTARFGRRERYGAGDGAQTQARNDHLLRHRVSR